MAVYTQISKKDIFYINEIFNDEKFLSFKGIKQGIENTNYLLRSKNNNLIQKSVGKILDNLTISKKIKLTVDVDPINFA